MIKELHEKLKNLPRISVFNVMRYTKMERIPALQILDELLEYRFEMGIVEDKSKIKYGRKSVKAFTKLYQFEKLDGKV